MPLLVKLKTSVCGVREIKVEKLHSGDKICHVCLSKKRRLHYLGVHFDVFQRICNFGDWNSKTVRVCWECLATLRRIKFFQAKCFEAATKLAINKLPVKSLSSFTCVVNRNDIIEAIPIVIGRDAPEDESTDDLGSESSIGETDGFEVFTEDYRAGSPDKTDDSLASRKAEPSAKDSKSDNGESEQKAKRKKGAWQEEMKGDFVIVKLQWDQVRKYIGQLKINADELKHWRGVESYSPFYVNERYKCKKCILGFTNLEQYREHKRRYHDESIGPFICDICRTHFATKSHLEAHVSTHYDMFKCTVCGFQCFSKRRIKLHVQKHKKTVQCVHCDTTCANFGTFKKHFKSHHSVFICDYCGKESRTKYMLEKHIRRHSVPNVCKICGKQYKSRSTLRNHMGLKHSKPKSSELAYCVQCNKQYPNEAVYRRHVLASVAHAAERDAGRFKKEVPCPICGNVYSRKAYMMNHYKHVHMKQSNFYCVDCDRYFLNRTRYVEHRKYHHEGETKVKNNVCNVCGKGFAAKRTLLNHIRTHSGERPYACTYCDASFTQKHGLLSHVKYIHKKSKRRGLS